MYFFIKLLLVCFLTLLLLIAELVLDHFTHSLTLLVVAWQTLYNFLTLFISCVALALTNNSSKSLAQKVSYNWKLFEKQLLLKCNTVSYNGLILNLLFFLEYIWVEACWSCRVIVQPDIPGGTLFWHNSWIPTNNCTQRSSWCDAQTGTHLHFSWNWLSHLVSGISNDWRLHFSSKDGNRIWLAEKESTSALP